MKFLVPTFLSIIIFVALFRVNESIKLRLKSRHGIRLRNKLRVKDFSIPDELRFAQENLNSRTKFRRYTKDGRPCASSFSQDGKIFTDCTSTKSPDGKITGDEWCYVDPAAGGNPKWAYCKPVLDYDKVRMRTRDIMGELIVDIRRVSNLVFNQIAPSSKIITTLDITLKKQASIDSRISVASKSKEYLEDNYRMLLEYKKQWEDLEKEIIELKTEIRDLEDTDDGKNPFNCDGLLGYESEPAGDGLLGLYYDNEDFRGSPLQDTVDDLDHQWERESPAQGINPENFSIKWTTFIRIPTKGMYTFYSSSDDGNAVFLNGQPIISHQMRESEVLRTASEINSNSVENNKNQKKTEGIIAESSPVFLMGGNKYKLEVNMFHSVHNEEKETGVSFIRLFWSSPEMEKQLIDGMFFYSANKIPPIKISDYDPGQYQLTILKENDRAFKNTDIYRIVDIPFQYEGSATLKVDYEFEKPEIFFSSTADLILYIAFAVSSGNPLPLDFIDTKDGITVLTVDKLKKIKPSSEAIRARSSSFYKIFKRKFERGSIKVPLTYTKRNPIAHLLIFYSLDPASVSPLSCGGKEFEISNPKLDAFESCSVSSKFSGEGWGCESGFSGRMLDERQGVWASQGQGLGAWIELKMKGVYQISKIQIKNRANPSERNSKLELSLGFASEPKMLSLKNIDEIQDFSFDPPLRGHTVRFTIKSVYGTMNNGGSFSVWGVPCLDPSRVGVERLSASENPLKTQKINLGCDDSIVNKQVFQTMNLMQGDNLTLVCDQPCSSSRGEIYGDLIYSDDSIICKAAFHAGALKTQGGVLKVAINRGEEFYKGGFRNGIKSNSRKGTQYSISFVGVSSGNPLDRLVTGIKVDIFDKNIKKWLAGIIQNSERIDSKFLKLTVSKENFDQKFNEVVTWPNKEIVTWCGEMLKERICDRSSVRPQDENSAATKIAFGPGPLKLSDYQLDSGKIFGNNGPPGMEFGWSRDNQGLARTRHINRDELLDSLLLFAPHPSSTWCSGSADSNINCEPIDWKLKVDPDLYEIKLIVGDPGFKVKYDIAINGRKVIDRILEKNQFYTIEEKIQVSDGFLVLTSPCHEDCEFSWSRISSLEIKKYETADKKEGTSESNTNKLGCGVAYKGGRCNTGPDVENCVYDSAFADAIQYCGGTLNIVKIPAKYSCREQIGKLKCIKVKFETGEECSKSCPGRCFSNRCLAISL